MEMTDAFCREFLNEEYADLCRKLALALARKRPSPLLRGKPATWACGIVRTIGWVNYRGDYGMFRPDARQIQSPAWFSSTGATRGLSGFRRRGSGDGGPLLVLGFPGGDGDGNVGAESIDAEPNGKIVILQAMSRPASDASWRELPHRGPRGSVHGNRFAPQTPARATFFRAGSLISSNRHSIRL